MYRALYLILAKERLLLGPSGAVSGLNKPRSLSLSSKASAPVANHPSGHPMNLLELVNVFVVLEGEEGPKAAYSILDVVQ